MARQTRTEDAGINLTPMIDVVFLLVIFFMVSAEVRPPESQIDIRLPKSGMATAVSRTPDPITVAIAADGTVTVDRRTMSTAELTQTLSAAATQYPDLRVAVRGEATMNHQLFVQTLDAVRMAGVTNIGIATETTRR